MKKFEIHYEYHDKKHTEVWANSIEDAEEYFYSAPLNDLVSDNDLNQNIQISEIVEVEEDYV